VVLVSVVPALGVVAERYPATDVLPVSVLRNTGLPGSVLPDGVTMSATADAGPTTREATLATLLANPLAPPAAAPISRSPSLEYVNPLPPEAVAFGAAVTLLDAPVVSDLLALVDPPAVGILLPEGTTDDPVLAGGGATLAVCGATNRADPRPDVEAFTPR